MDAVELPLPANAVVPKLIANGKSLIADLSVFKRPEASTSGPFRKDKSHILKQKRSLDAKRTEKKIMRANGKTRFDSLAMKPGLSHAGSVCAGNTTLGVYGLKSNLYNVTGLVDDPPLSELLDGSYRCPKLYPDKVKKVHQTNKNFLLSIKMALDILPTRSAEDSGCKTKALSCLSSLASGSKRNDDGDGADNCTVEIGSLSNVQDSLQSDTTASILYQPKDLFHRLELPPTHNLPTLISESNAPVLPAHRTLSTFSHRGGSLPPFSWSFGNGACKSNADLSKSAPIRTVCQSRWVRIARNSTSVGEAKIGFFEIDMQASSCSRSLMSHNKNDLLDSVISLISSEEFCFSKSGGPNEGHLQSKTTSSSDRWNSLLNVQGKQRGLGDSHINLEPQDSSFHVSLEAECGSRGRQSNCRVEFEKNANGAQKSHQFGNTFSSASISGHYVSNYECGESNLTNHSTISETSKEDHSPRALAAATVLYGLATASKAQSRGYNNFNVKWKKKSSYNAPKEHNFLAPNFKAEDTCEVSRHHDPERSSGPSLTRNKFIFEKNSSQANYTGGGPANWLDREEGPCPSKSGKSHSFELKPLHVSSTRLMNLKSSSARVEKKFDHQQRLRKTWTSPPSTFNGTHIKDWNRGKTKRL